MSTFSIKSNINKPFSSSTFWAYLQLMRPANIATAWADILLGYAAAGAVTNINHPDLISLGWLILATTGLYGGGVVFNDVCDADLDALERPERPIPSSRASLAGAIALGTVLLSLGILSSAMVSRLSAILALIVAIMALVYDQWGKHQKLLGPINMGVCRGCNLLLGVSTVSGAVGVRWYLALIPIVYIAAITAISQGEVHGGKKTTGMMAIALICLVIGSILALAILPEYTLLNTFPFLTLFIVLVLPPFIRAAIDPQAQLIRMAVKAGILSLIVLDATVASGFSHWLYGLCLLTLLPLSRFLGKMFAIT